MCQWIDNNKSMYNGEDLANYLILYNNLGVIKADGFRKNLGIKNQSIRNERDNSCNNENICERNYGKTVQN